MIYIYSNIAIFVRVAKIFQGLVKNVLRESRRTLLHS